MNRVFLIGSFLVGCLTVALSGYGQVATTTTLPQTKNASVLTTSTFILAEPLRPPVITWNTPGSEDNKHGYEGGSVVKVDGVYHLFTAEMFGDPFWWQMRLARWTSPDAIKWQRAATLFTSGGQPNPDDPYASIWAPMPIYNEKEGRWNLFYIAYRGPKLTEQGGHYNGRVLRAASQTPGRAGIGGPYKDVDISLYPGAQSQPWEGQQGTDSFFAWSAGGRWYGMYGSHNHRPLSPWPVGLASAPELAGPWTRCPAGNPLPLDPIFVENPIVTRLEDGAYAVVYDADNHGGKLEYKLDPLTIGLAFSPDGIHWGQGALLPIHPDTGTNWSSDIRTPLGLIPEGGGRYTLLYTAKLKDREFWAVGMVRLQRAPAKP